MPMTPTTYQFVKATHTGAIKATVEQRIPGGTWFGKAEATSYCLLSEPMDIERLLETLKKSAIDGRVREEISGMRVEERFMTQAEARSALAVALRELADEVDSPL